MPRRKREDFDQDFLDAVTAIPDDRTPQHTADTHVDRRQKCRVKDYYPIYSDNPAQWQADLMFLPFTNTKNETRLHALFVSLTLTTSTLSLGFYPSQLREVEGIQITTRLNLLMKTVSEVLTSMYRDTK